MAELLLAAETHATVHYNSGWRAASHESWLLPCLLRCADCGGRQSVARRVVCRSLEIERVYRSWI